MLKVNAFYMPFFIVRLRKSASAIAAASICLGFAGCDLPSTANGSENWPIRGSDP